MTDKIDEAWEAIKQLRQERDDLREALEDIAKESPIGGYLCTRLKMGSIAREALKKAGEA